MNNFITRLELDLLDAASRLNPRENPTQRIDPAERRRTRSHPTHRGGSRNTMRTFLVSLLAVTALSGCALAAGNALGVIELGGGGHAEHVSSYPAYNLRTHRFVKVHKQYIYHITGGLDDLSQCNKPHPNNNIYVTSTRPLTSQILEHVLRTQEHLEPFRGFPQSVTSISQGCGNAGIEATVGTPPPPHRRQHRR